MKLKLQIALIVIISLLQFQSVNAQLATKDLGTPKFNGQGNPTSYKFAQQTVNKDSVIYTQQVAGLNILTKAALWIPVTWYATADSGFVANGAYTVEAKVAINKSGTNGFGIEMEGVPGKRFKIGIDTTAIYNMTYSPSTAKEVIVNNLNNKGMHTYRVAVDNADKAHIYRDGVKVGNLDVDGLVSSSSYYKDLEVIQDDKFFEDFKDLATPAFAVNNATLAANLSGNWDIVQSGWCKMGIDTLKANVKVGLTSFWYNNGTSGELKILKKGLTPGKYKLSYWCKTTQDYEGARGTIKMGTTVLLPYQLLVSGNKNFNYREFPFDVTTDGDITITFHNGWSNQNPGWSNMWFDDLRIAKVAPVSYLRFGKDSEAGVTDFTLGSMTYDMTGAFAPTATAIAENKTVLNYIYTSNANGVLNVNYSLAKGSKTTIQLIDLSGRILHQQTNLSNEGRNSTSIQSSNLKGVYLLRLITADAAKTVKVEVK